MTVATHTGSIQLYKPSSEWGFLSIVTRSLTLLTLAVCVIVPHSFQIPTAALMALTGFFAVLGLRKSEWLNKIMMLYCAGTAITVFYLFVGYLNGAPDDAIVQNGIVYVAAPLIWIVIGASAVQRFGVNRLTSYLTLYTWAALLSIVLFFYAYLTFGRDSVKFLTEDANVNVNGGFAGATMLVYGSMIFLTGAFFAAPGLLRWRLARFIMPVALVMAAVTSGRSAFVIAVPIGYLVGVVLRPGLSDEEQAAAGRGVSLLSTLGMLVAVIIGIFALSFAFAQLDLVFIGNLFWNKLTSGGGNERVEQARALWDGIEQSYGLGVGHGIGVHYLRSDEFPWRYELLPLASILRVGIAGSIIYALPFAFYANLLLKRLSAKQLRLVDIYMAGGLVAALVGTFTNPYLESFIFEWMYFIPVVALGLADTNPSPATLVSGRPDSHTGLSSRVAFKAQD